MQECYLGWEKVSFREVSNVLIKGFHCVYIVYTGAYGIPGALQSEWHTQGQLHCLLS